MLTNASQSRCALVAIAATIGLCAPALAQCNYTYVQIPKPAGWPYNPGLSLNNHGVVAGLLQNAGDVTRVYTWSEETGNFILPLPPGIISMESAFINDAGHVAGAMFSYDARDNSSAWYGFVWDGANYTIIGLPAWANSIYVSGINNDDQVIGTIFNSGRGPQRAFTWEDGTLTELSPQFVPDNSHGHTLNNSRALVGRASGAFVMRDTNVRYLDRPPESTAPQPNSINETDVVAGKVSRVLTPGQPASSFATVWMTNSIATVEPPEGTQHSFMTAINNANRAVGYYWLGVNPTYAAFAWQNGAVAHLAPLVVPGPPSYVYSAHDINNSGQILAYFDNHTALLTPHWLPGDLTGDCHVWLEDLAVVLANFGSSAESYPLGDLDMDGDVDLNDLAVLLAYLGE